MTYNIIAAVGRDGSIGAQGWLPWPFLAVDFRWFFRLTATRFPQEVATALLNDPHAAYVGAPALGMYIGEGNILIMGQRTYRTLRHLDHRRTVVLQNSPLVVADPLHGLYAQPSMLAALRWCEGCLEEDQHVWAIGGTRVFAEALGDTRFEVLMLTEVEATYPEADTWFPGEWDWDQGLLTGAHGESSWRWERETVSKWVQGQECPAYRLTRWVRTKV